MGQEADERAYVIRAATLEDWQMLWPLLCAMGGVATSEDDVRARLAGLFASDDYLVSVADNGGSLDGYAWAQDYGPHLRTGKRIARLHDLFVVPAHRRCGIGTQLFTAVVSWAEERGVTWLQWQASSQALPFYERLGHIGDPCPDRDHPFFEIAF